MPFKKDIWKMYFVNFDSNPSGSIEVFCGNSLGKNRENKELPKWLKIEVAENTAFSIIFFNLLIELMPINAHCIKLLVSPDKKSLDYKNK